MNAIEQRIVEIEERLKATTGGPWIMKTTDGRKNIHIESAEVVTMDRPDARVATLFITAWKIDKRDARPDAQFICEARQDVTWLIGELRAALKRIELLERAES